jgi:cell division protein FtsW
MMLISGAKLRKIGVVILVYLFFGVMFFTLKSLNDDKEENLKSAIETEVVVKKTSNNNEDILNDDNPVIQFFVKNFGRGGTWVARFIRHYTPPQLVEQEMNQLNQQEMYARMAQANSNNLGIGPIGVGPGNSRECSRLPLAFSDYIYSIIVEELGIAGALFVLVMYVGLIFRAKKLARQCSYAFPSFLVLGMSVMISLQGLFHMAINTGVVPVSGQPLPLISMGGTSILMVSAAFGIILSVSRYAIQNSQDKELKKAELNQLPENLRSENPLYIKK